MSRKQGKEGGPSNRPFVYTPSNRPVISRRLMVCAIDFGTTYSGYAYSMNNDPKKIFCDFWNSGTSTLISYKTPTTVLLDAKQNFLAFGYEAERKYLDLVEKEEDNNLFYFRRFKMILYDKVRTERLTMETKVSDIKGKELPAVDIFSHAIRYLKNHLYEQLKNKFNRIQDENIEWVLTVPAIWDDPAKQFMRKAAEKAGIETNRLVIALEPEAASIFCKELPVEKFEGESNNIDVFSPGQRYLVLDAGGGTIDMTVHEVKTGGKLQELSRASGGDWGGVTVDKTFKQMLIDIVGENFMEKYCKEFTAEYIEMFKDFEVKKRQKMSESSQSGRITLKISSTFLDEYENENGRAISLKTKETKYANSLKWSGDKLRMKKDLFQSFFKTSCEEIISLVRKLLADPNVKGTKIILMVGAFSESEIVQQAVRNAFPNCRVVIPQEAGLAVLKGAVIFGHDPSVIDARIAKYTYGIETSELFDPNKHELKRKQRDKKDGKDRCYNIFSKHVEVGTVLYRNEEQGEHTYTPIYADQKHISFPVYISEIANNPKYTDEPGCNCMGKLEMDISKTIGSLKREFAAKLKFGGTEITVSARNVQTDETVHIQIDFLGDEP